MSLSTNPYRLARTVVPSAYRIFLTPDLEGATFAGRVEIDVHVAQSTPRITLHALDLALGAATLAAASKTYRSADPTYDEKFQTATFTFDEALPEGAATLEIAFTGVLNDLLVGFYRSTFTGDDGRVHTIATTQFEHSDARRAFPCWDEPSYKATFQVNLTVPSDLAAYSNSPETSSTDLGNGWRTVTFAPTMVMSSYLVAFVVGPFEETPAIDVDGVAMRIIYPLGKGHLTEMALDAGAFALHFFADYFAIPYPGDKLDMVAIPDFSFGAMENLGLVTYRESLLLIDPATASLLERQRVAEVIAHEIAHMWFGDLVTMEWWEGIWLNEAFATFMATLCVDAYKPEWRMWVDFGIDRDAALQVDGLHSTRPIEYEVVSPEDTRGMFDVLTYQKGGSVLRMLEQYLGDTTFRDGIRQYLRTHAYANTVTTDLWDALEAASGQPVREMMNTWILQGGHPLVTLANGELTQQPFAYGPLTGESAIGQSWLVPVMTRSLDAAEVTRHLVKTEPVAVSENPPVVVNAGGSGVYRTRYGSTELASISARLGDLDELERATLVADTWAATLAGHTEWPDFVSLLKGLGVREEPNLWTIGALGFDLASRVLTGSARETLASQAREIFTPLFDHYGFDPVEGESELAPQVRATALSVLGTLGGREDVRTEAVRRFEANDLHGDTARAVLRVVARQDRPGDYATFLERYAAAGTPQEEVRYLYSLGEFDDEATALDAARRCFDEFRNQDGPIVLGLMTMNAHTGPAVWRYITSRWDEALEKFPPSTQVRLALGVNTFISDAPFAEEVAAF
ncbi:MAG: M1 family metallopeptidase, partial [Acidobacteriota bacterium]|nr:M1 family metallopeptidase [Acidobacteriota bacterium]